MNKKDKSKVKVVVSSELKIIDNNLSVVNKANEIKLNKINAEIKEAKIDIDLISTDLFKALEESSKNSKEEVKILESILEEPIQKICTTNTNDDETWEQTVTKSKNFLIRQSIDPNEIFHYNLIPKEELFKIIDYLDRPMYDRIKWDKYDFLVCFGAGILGGLIDIYACTAFPSGNTSINPKAPKIGLEKLMANKDSWLGKIMEDIHAQHPGNAAIDFTGTQSIIKPDGVTSTISIGGPYHRGMSSGHDLFRIFNCVKQLYLGKFQGVAYRDGVGYLFESTVNSKGNPFVPMDIGNAFLNCIIHLFCDYFSTTSLPIPGTTWLRESSNRDIRELVMKELYEKGIHLRHLTLQFIPPIVVSVLIIIYFYFRYFDKNVPREAKIQKISELLALSHSITCAINVGKVYIMNDPYQLNIPQVVAACLSIASVIFLETGRNNFIKKFERNNNDLMKDLKDLEEKINIKISNEIILK